jgi:hypothetical protein
MAVFCMVERQNKHSQTRQKYVLNWSDNRKELVRDWNKVSTLLEHIFGPSECLECQHYTKALHEKLFLALQGTKTPDREKASRKLTRKYLEPFYPSIPSHCLDQVELVRRHCVEPLP